MSSLFSGPTTTQKSSGLSTARTNSIESGTTASSSTARTTLPGYVTDAQQAFYGQLPSILNGYLYEPGSKVAALSPDQRTASQLANQVAATAMGTTLPGVSTAEAGQVDPGAIAQFMSPYIGNVARSAYNALTQQNADAKAELGARAAAAGSFGGSREAVGEAQIDKATQGQLSQTVSALLNGGWQTAGQLAGLNAQLTNSTNQFNAGQANEYNLKAPTVQQALRLSAIQQLLGIGDRQQAVEQAIYDTPLKALALWNSAIPQQYDTTKVADAIGTMSGTKSGTSIGTQSSTTTEQKTANPLSVLMGTLLSSA